MVINLSRTNKGMYGLVWLGLLVIMLSFVNIVWFSFLSTLVWSTEHEMGLGI